jgi:hypothetical protein
MIYRKLDQNLDYTFGQGSGNFLVNSPATVAQAVQTRLALNQGEWFLNTNAGTPYGTLILGHGTLATYAPAIQAIIVDTQGVTQLSGFSGYVDPATRQATVSGTIDPQYGTTTIQANL